MWMNKIKKTDGRCCPEVVVCEVSAQTSAVTIAALREAMEQHEDRSFFVLCPDESPAAGLKQLPATIAHSSAV